LGDPIRVLVVDRHELFRRGVIRALQDRKDLEVVGEADRGARALGLARELMPDVVLVDLDLHDDDGLQFIRSVRGHLPYVRVLALSIAEEDAVVFEAVKAGASGCVLKNAPAGQLVEAIQQAARGEAVLSGTLAFRMLEELAKEMLGPGTRRPARTEREVLTPRESEILRLVCRGLTNREIGDRLGISAYTVRNHLRNVLQKLHVRNRAQAAAWAVRGQLLER